MTAQPMTAAIGAVVKRRREAMGMSQPQLAAWMGMHGRPEWVVNQISAFERGRRKWLLIEDLLLLSAALKCSLPALLGDAHALVMDDFALTGPELCDVLAGRSRVGDGGHGTLELVQVDPSHDFARLSLADVEGLRAVADMLDNALEKMGAA